MVAVTKFVDLKWSCITDCVRNAQSSTVFKDFVVQGQGLVNWFSRILEDKDFPEDKNTGCITVEVSTTVTFRNSKCIIKFKQYSQPETAVESTSLIVFKSRLDVSGGSVAYW